MKKQKKFITILFVLFFLLIYTPMAYASNLGNVIQGGDSFLNSKKDTINTLDAKAVKDLSDTLYNTLFVLAIVIAFVVGGILGIRFITEGVEGQAEIKSMLTPYIIGCCVIFGAFTIWKIIVTIFQ